jgi:hypothetical protein
MAALRPQQSLERTIASAQPPVFRGGAERAFAMPLSDLNSQGQPGGAIAFPDPSALVAPCELVNVGSGA